MTLNNAGRFTYRCSDASSGDPEFTPTAIDVATYCSIEDCSSVGSTIINPETLAAFWPWALLMFATAFAIRMIRKTIYSKV